MKNILLIVSVLMFSLSASANFVDDLGKGLSLMFGQCPPATKAKVEAILNNTDLSQPTIVRHGNRPFKLYTKNNPQGLRRLCEKDLPELESDQVYRDIRQGFFCGNRVFTCNVSKKHERNEKDDEQSVVAEPADDKPSKGDNDSNGGGNDDSDDNDDNDNNSGGNDDSDDNDDNDNNGGGNDDSDDNDDNF